MPTKKKTAAPRGKDTSTHWRMVMHQSYGSLPKICWMGGGSLWTLPLTNTTVNGEHTSDPEEEANIFLEQFSPNSTTPPTNPEKLKEIEKGIQNVEAEPLNSYFNMQELPRSLSLLSDKAMGLDKTHNRMLRNLNLENRKRLLQIINLMFKEGYIPEAWKCAIVTLKPRKPPGEAESYRPISLTSCIGKMMEKMINNRLKWHLDHLRRYFCTKWIP